MPHTSHADVQKTLAEKEKEAASHIELGRIRIVLMLCCCVFLIGLLLPHSGKAHGYDVLFHSQNALSVQVKITEYLFVWLGSVAVVIINSALVLTQRTIFANISFLLSGIALIISLFALWLRLQNAENLGLSGIGMGFYLEVSAVVVSVYALCRVIFAKSEKQRALAIQRAQHEELDEVAYAQRSALVSRQHNTPETNPLFVDDRRQQAMQRFRTNSDG
ncbi:hypothetical protein EML15_01310 [Corynebacterium sp. sy017]|uniref:Rv2732c family membrane protein n=1 Tax=unclassified Corynebacterium TaxID=2624378 RepID=UPI001184F193|nr:MULTISPECIES: hypothetical protein [unclassified Corynebacterium]MBP3087792.1 hypothetical protein [Corynebacterium sp. sy017]QDZ42768.1 hypothetical protein FQV43_06055 [Corynebacterium sp. sy039]TSD92341.1 hypothetical protein ELY17_01310 [Corynebacterium sp. SY003]